MSCAPKPSVISLLGAPHTGVQALALALQERLDPAQMCVIFGPLNDPSAFKAASTSAQSNPQNAPVVELRPAMLTLLMGLDLPCPAGERLEQEAADLQLRSALECANTAYKVVYGQGDARIQHALNAIKIVASSGLENTLCHDQWMPEGSVGRVITGSTKICAASTASKRYC